MRKCVYVKYGIMSMCKFNFVGYKHITMIYNFFARI